MNGGVGSLDSPIIRPAPACKPRHEPFDVARVRNCCLKIEAHFRELPSWYPLFATQPESLPGFAIPRILSQNVSHVAVVLLADILHQFLFRKEVDPPVNGKGPGVRSWIVNIGLPFQVLEVRPSVTLDRVELLRVWVTGKVKPELVVEPDRVDDQRVSVPFTDRFPE